jgi:hypothetical protein
VDGENISPPQGVTAEFGAVSCGLNGAAGTPCRAKPLACAIGPERHLGVCYEMGGCGLMKYNEQAVAYYEKACNGGEMDMCNNLGVCDYEGGCWFTKDDA